jgi:hypothetical protein
VVDTVLRPEHHGGVLAAGGQILQPGRADNPGRDQLPRSSRLGLPRLVALS